MAPGKAAGGISLAKLLPALVLGVGLAVFFTFDGPSYLSFDALHKNRRILVEWIDAHQVLSALIFIAIYTAATAFSLPVGVVLTLGGGFLFGSAFAMSLPGGWHDTLVETAGPSGPSIVGSVMTTLYIVVGATVGATIVFIAARTAFSGILHAKAGPWLRVLEAGFRKNSVTYMLLLRLVPVFPFWLVNLAPAFLGVGLKVYVLTTFIGILPGTFVYTLVGNGLGSVFAACDLRPEDVCRAPDLGSVLVQPGVILPIVGLALLAGVPLLYRRIKARLA